MTQMKFYFLRMFVGFILNYILISYLFLRIICILTEYSIVSRIAMIVGYGNE
jgi:hypothetical protein